MLHWRQKILHSFSIVMLLTVVSGCGSDDRIKVYQSTGTLTLDGEPFGPTSIQMIPVDASGRSAVGNVDDKGVITFTTYGNGDGLPAGDYRVAVGISLAPPPRPFPMIYKDFSNTPLKVTIAPNTDNKLAIEMTKKAGPSQSAASLRAAEKMAAPSQGSNFSAGVKE